MKALDYFVLIGLVAIPSSILAVGYYVSRKIKVVSNEVAQVHTLVNAKMSAALREIERLKEEVRFQKNEVKELQDRQLQGE